MERNYSYKGWIYILPALIFLAIFTIYPIIDTFYISFLEDYNYLSGEYSKFSFENYLVLLGIHPFPNDRPGAGDVMAFMKYALPNTLLITFITVPISIIIALLIALAINKIKVFKKLFQAIFFTPYVTNIIAIGMVFGVIFAQNGLINTIFNLDKSWIDGIPSPSYWDAMFVLFVDIIWYQLPFKILIFLGALQNIDKQYYDAAKIDGSNKVKTFFKITLPLMSPQVLYISITSFIGGFKEYESVAGLFGRSGTTAGGYDLYTCVYYIYDQIAKGGENIAYACAGAIILFLIIAIFTLIQMIISKKVVFYK